MLQSSKNNNEYYCWMILQKFNPTSECFYLKTVAIVDTWLEYSL